MTLSDWITMLAEEHTRSFLQALAAILAIVGALFGFVIGRISAFRAARRIIRAHKELENSGIVVFEAHELYIDPEDGGIRLKISSWGGKHTLTELLHDPILEAGVVTIARKREGFLRIEESVQKLLMIAFEEAITGNDPVTNLNRLKGRRHEEDEVIMCPVTWPGTREAHLIRVVLIDTVWIERLADPAIVAKIRVTDPRHEQRPQWLHNIAIQWKKEQRKPWEVACIWNIEI